MFPFMSIFGSSFTHSNALMLDMLGAFEAVTLLK